MPQRCCVMCRHKGEKQRFLRLLLQDSAGLFLDVRQDLPGRGAYCCKTQKCLGAKNLGARVVFALEKGSASSKKARRGAAKKRSRRDAEESSELSRSPEVQRICGEKAAGLQLVEQALRQFERAPQGQGEVVRDLNKLRELLLQKKTEAKAPKKRTSSIRL